MNIVRHIVRHSPAELWSEKESQVAANMES